MTLALPTVFDAMTCQTSPNASRAAQPPRKDKNKVMETWSFACRYSLHRVVAAVEQQGFLGLIVRRKGDGTCQSCKHLTGTYDPTTMDELDPGKCLENLSATGLHNAALSLIKILNKYLKYPQWID
jgi:hypothetical protein